MMNTNTIDLHLPGVNIDFHPSRLMTQINRQYSVVNVRFNHMVYVRIASTQVQGSKKCKQPNIPQTGSPGSYLQARRWST
jgi:hypothetical protein